MHSRESRVRLLFVTLLVALTAMGCSSYKPVRPPLAEGLSGPHAPRSLDVQLVDGTRFELREASVTADSLRRLRIVPDDPRGPIRVPYAVALTEVRAVEGRRLDGLLTVLLLLAGVAGFYAWLISSITN